jgi:ferredoxin/flavodoxin
MNAEIYYFTGTGNSLIVARDIAEKLKCRLIPAASLAGLKKYETGADIIGIVFPVYFCGTPLIIRDFFEKLADIKNKYIFAVCTYGGGTGDSLKTPDKILRSRGGKLSGRYGIHMPQNAFLKPWENHLKIIGNRDKKLDKIVKNTELQKNGRFLSNIISYILLLPFRGLFRYLLKKSLSGLSNIPPKHSFDELIKSSDRSYTVTDNCSGCGICMEVCPVNNIKIRNKKPVWNNNCETCLACYNWCPEKAIQGGISNKGYYYRNPFVTFADMKMQKEVFKGKE